MNKAHGPRRHQMQSATPYQEADTLVYLFSSNLFPQMEEQVDGSVFARNSG
jgi:hypothetical protein